jgi:hypothetical protein
MLLKPFYVLTVATAAWAMTAPALAQATRVTLAPAQDAWKISTPTDSRRVPFVLRQDLFDRNDPNNLRSDYPGPPGQPGPAH